MLERPTVGPLSPGVPKTPLDALPPQSRWISPVETKAHLPAFAVRADSGDSGMMGEPIDPFGGKGISIKFDKFR